MNFLFYLMIIADSFYLIFLKVYMNILNKYNKGYAYEV